MKARTTRHTLLVALAVSALGTTLWLRPQDVAATPASPEPQPFEGPAADAGVDEEEPTTATLVFATSPAVPAIVSWGKKRLGRITPKRPLVVVRPRDSGPLDVMVRAPGYLAVQTRAHTFSSHRVLVKLTPLDQKSELLGYRAPLDAGVDVAEEAALEAVADGGVAQGAVTAPAMPAAPAR